MKLILYILGSLACLITISIVWQFISQQSTPCPVWLSWLVEFDNPFAKAHRAKVIIEHLDLKPGMKVADIGCGPGRLTIPIAEILGTQGEIVAMDIQEGMLVQVKQKANIAKLSNIRFLNAGIGSGKLERNYFDRILLISVLGEIPNQQQALKEIFDALKPSGILSVTETIFDPHYQRKETVLQLTESIGFQEKKIIGNRLAFTLQLEKPI